jgi:hypothetical protein
LPDVTTLDLGEAIAAELRRMIVRCTSCTAAVMCEPCFTADRLLARYDEADNDDFLRLAGRHA